MLDKLSEATMTTQSDFIFGQGFIVKNKIIKWSPDDYHTQNAHMLIVGGSGSGKTRLLKKIIEYLNNRKKQVYVIDFHGDIVTGKESCYQFSLRNSKYGLNPFEMEIDVENGGPIAQANIILANFKKNFIPNIGAVQRSVLKQFLIDCYRYVGILDEDESTWHKVIPTITTLLELYKKISSIIKYSEGHTLYKQLSKLGKINRDIYYETDPDKEELLQKKIEKEIEKFSSLCNKYQSYLTTKKYSDMFNISISPYVDMEYYLDEKVSKAFMSLSPYLAELGTSSVFNDNKPPKTRGVVRYDISGFTNAEKPSEAMFFADTVIQKIFRAVKLRGEYRKLKNKKGKADTFVVIDESKLILPTGKDKENPYNILNRIVAESRKYGMGLIIVSQRPDHFPDEMLSSIYTKVVLRINENDVKRAIKALGVKDPAQFSLLKEKNVALVGTTGGLFDSVKLAYEE